MATVSERARELAMKVSNLHPYFDDGKAPELIEQALLAERRLAMEEAAKIADTVEIHYSGKGHITLPASTVRSNIAALLRSAAEKDSL